MKKLKKGKMTKGLIDYQIDPTKIETTSGLFVSAGEISDDFDKVEWKTLLEDYTSMRNGGAVESTTISILKYPILRVGFYIEHKDPEIKKYCNWVLDNLVDSFGDLDGFQEFISHLFLALDYGCSFFEKIYENGVYTPERKITNIISRLAPFKPETIWKFHYNELMQFSGITHERRHENSVNSFVDIPTEKLFFYAHNSEYGDPRGRSELRPIRNLYKIKKDILLATARAQQRGAGIPEIKIKKSGMTAEEKSQAHLVGKSIGNMKSGYVITDENTELTLHSLQIQGNPETMLEFINREMFFNTLTEFMASGIGQSGSRSATSEHKGSYELKCGVVIQAIEKRLDLLLREIMDISYLAPIDSYPTFKFNALSQTDIVGASNALNKFYSSAVLTKQPGDEDFIRGFFNMPLLIKDVIKNSEEVERLDDNTVGETGITAKYSLDNKKFMRVLSNSEQIDFLKKTFDVEAAENLYTDIQAGAEVIIKEVSKKYIMYIAQQVDKGGLVEIKYNTELANRLNKLYRDGLKEGRYAVERELQKLESGVTLAANPKVGDIVKTSSQSIIRFADRMIFNIKTVAEDMLDTDWKKARGSATEYIIEKNLEDGFKTDRRTLIQKTSDGYLDGRADSLEENKKNIELYFYNSILDTNLCDACASFTGAILTLEEAESLNFIVGRRGRINENCSGGLGKCRCNLMPYKLKGDFKV